MQFTVKNLLNFLNSIEGWADENAKESTPRPGLKTIVIRKGNWIYVDQYVGGEPFQGLEIVWFKKLPVWSMSYRGFWNPKDYKTMLCFVRKALKNHPKNAPWRGPKTFSSKGISGWNYANNWHGNIREFRGLEKIFFKQKEVGWTLYQGGLVNKKHLSI